MTARQLSGRTPDEWAGRLLENRRFASPYQRLNPLTALVIGVAGVAGAIALPFPALVLAFVVFLGMTAFAHEIGRAWRPAVGLALLVAAVIAALNLLAGRPADDAARAATDGALQTGLVILSILLFLLTTDPPSLGLDLERRGLGRGLVAFLVGSLRWGPTAAARLRAISAAQRARGLRIGRNPVARLANSAPLLLPALVLSLGGLSERTVALEARASSSTARRSLLWAPPDPAWERGLRWVLVIAIIAVVVLRLTGHLA